MQTEMDKYNCGCVPMEFTGERYIPEIEGQIALEHLHRYALASTLAEGKRVLDIASGEGYGSHLLAKVAAHVIGVDISAEAINHAKSKYTDCNLDFRIGSTTSIPVDSKSVDLVVSFETIEHIAEHEEMLSEIKRVLRTDGVLIISSPNKQNYSIIPNYRNPFHVKELFQYEFEHLIKKNFKQHSFSGQQVFYGSWIFPHKNTREEIFHFGLDGGHTIKNCDVLSIYEVALASDSNLPILSSSILNQEIDKSEYAIQIQALLREKSETIERVNNQLKENERELLILRKTISERDLQIQTFLRETSEATERVNNLLREAEELNTRMNQLALQTTARINDLERALYQAQAVIDAMRASTSWRMTAFFRWCSTLAKQCGPLRWIRALASSRSGSLAFRSLPLPERLRTALKSAVFRRAGWLFRGSLSYRAWQARELYSDKAAAVSAKDDVCNGWGADGGDEAIDEAVTEGKKRILVIDWTTPRPDCDAGSVTAYFFLKAFVELGYHVTFIPDDLVHSDNYTSKLHGLGVRCITSREIDSIERFFKRWGWAIDIVLLYRVHIAAHHFPLVKQYAPQAKVIFDTVDLHYLREERQACTNPSSGSKAQALQTKQLELGMIRAADATIVLSTKERALLLQEDPGLNVINIPLLLEVPGRRKAFEERSDIVFIGGFLHQPNIDAVCYFVAEIWPAMQLRLPGVAFRIIGSSMPEEVLALNRVPGVDVLGFVENLDTVFDTCRLSVVPLRYGAGIKGKIGTSASYGVPCVSTSIGVEGMEMQDGINVLVADDPLHFAEQVTRLYSDKALWEKISAGSLDFVRNRYSYESGREMLRQLLSKLD